MWISPRLLKFTIYFVGSGGQLSRVFDLRSLSYLEHCKYHHKKDRVKINDVVKFGDVWMDSDL